MTNFRTLLARTKQEEKNRECCHKCDEPFEDGDDVMKVAQGKMNVRASHKQYEQHQAAIYCHKRCFHKK